MEMARNIFISFAFVCIIIFCSACSKDEIRLNKWKISDIAKKYIFQKGSYWVYEDTMHHLIDTVTCIESEQHVRGTVYEAGKYGRSSMYVIPYCNNTYLHSYTNTTINYLYFSSVLIQNPVIHGEYSFEGQWLYYFNSKKDTGFIYNDGFYVLPDTTLMIQGQEHVALHSRIIAAEQYQHEYDYDTDLYFVENIGLVLKHDAYHTWYLKEYNCTNVFNE